MHNMHKTNKETPASSTAKKPTRASATAKNGVLNQNALSEQENLTPEKILAIQRTAGSEVVQHLFAQEWSQPALQKGALPVNHESSLEHKVEKTLQSRQHKVAWRPDMLKTGIEDISGMSLDDVRTRANSPRPMKLNTTSDKLSGNPSVPISSSMRHPTTIQRKIVYKPGKKITDHDYEAIAVAIHASDDLGHLRELHEDDKKEYSIADVLQQFSTNPSEVDWGVEPPDAAPAPTPTPPPAPVSVSAPAPTSASVPAFGSDEKQQPSTRHIITGEEPQMLRNFDRITGALPKLNPRDRDMLELIRRTLDDDQCSNKEWRIITRYMKNVGHYDAKEEDAVADDVKPPQGYSTATAFGQIIFLKGQNKIDERHRTTAIAHLVGENIHTSTKMEGAPVGTPYLHTSKSDATSLYLIQIDGKSNGVSMYTILKQGHVSDGMHIFK